MRLMIGGVRRGDGVVVGLEVRGYYPYAGGIILCMRS
jgi:hypothetical protein